MRRLGARSAGRSVLALAGRLSDDLLLLEEHAFAETELLFVAYRSVAARMAQGRYRGETARKVFRPTMLADELGGVLSAALSDSTAVAGALYEQSAEFALASVEQELILLERTMAKSMRGIAASGVAFAQSQRQEMYEAAGDGYRDTLPFVLEGFVEDCQQQIRTSVAQDEPIEMFERRLFDMNRMNLTGNAGRGVWWRPLGSLKLALRTAEFGMVNALRETAMLGMNEAARALG